MRVTVPRPKTLLAGLWKAVDGTFSSRRSLVFGALLTASLYGVLVLSTFPEYTYQLLSADLFYLDQAILALTANLYATIGVFGLGLMGVYAVLTAVALMHFFIQVRSSGMGGALTGAGTAPAFLVGGCAGCGAGVLGLVGAAGAITLLPFQGNGIRLAGILLLAGVLGYAGDPRTCSVDR
ncbi:MAG: hypothetical protein SVW77_03865 [Candidatus Nanohaloarchaea archaeon]|nr:hypothetical protein [Candidatus Nanohaloarchaea archaeon]